MVSFRYHLISLTAVFFAMAIGVVVGSNVIDQPLINQLRSQRHRDQAQLAAERAQADALRGQLAVWSAVGEIALGPAIENKLRGKTVVLLTTKTRNSAIVGDVHDTLAEAGARFGGRIEFTEKWQLVDEQAREQLSLAFGGEKDAVALMQAAADRIAARLRSAAPIRDGDILRVLEHAGFLALSDMPRGAFPRTESLLVFVSSGEREGIPPVAGFGVPFVRALAGKASLAVAEPLNAPDSITDRITADADLRKLVSSVDHVDTFAGRYALVRGLEAIFSGGPASHYGVRRRTDGVIPAS